MKLLSLEKYLLKNNLDDEEFKKLVIKISEKLKDIKTKKDFDDFYRYLEEIVAYVKYYIG